MEDPKNDQLIRALTRGIGVHHSGLPKGYRQCVEILFRCGHLRVVIATGGAHSGPFLHLQRKLAGCHHQAGMCAMKEVTP